MAKKHKNTQQELNIREEAVSEETKTKTEQPKEAEPASEEKTEEKAAEKSEEKSEEKPAEDATEEKKTEEAPEEEEPEEEDLGEESESVHGKKGFGIFATAMLVTLLILCLAYVGVSIFYQTRFMPGTLISNCPAENRTPEQIDAMMKDRDAAYTMTLRLSDGQTESINGSDFDYRYDYLSSLTQILSSQKSYEWLWYLIYPAQYRATPEVNYDEGKLIAVLSELDCYRQKEANSSAVVAIENRMNHFTLRDDRKPALNTGKATDRILHALQTGEKECDLTNAYDAPLATASQEKTLKNWKAVEKVQNASLTYADDDLELVVDKYRIAPWIMVDDDKQPLFDNDGHIMLDEEGVKDFLTTLSDTFNTDQKNRIWTKYTGGMVEIPSRQKGYIVDEDAELEAMTKTVLNGWTQQRAPLYSQEGTGHGNAEVGDSWVEVDLGHQKLYYIEKGQLKLQSDIVTGCKRYHNDTPSMITDIYFMQKNRTLHGENYATFVYYWMAFYNHYGLHDATWRGKFGGDIYLTDGSHGCVNMPKENAAKLYDMVHVGTPVVLYE
ncbi:MAG: L,D-transpeptidase/peptidoglycan binding protein [Lachnospiraceae bacterium]|nr:L,D-transpeptidase/peptidoglycan binding protein [Lachnospiraceae bacterium]